MTEGVRLRRTGAADAVAVARLQQEMDRDLGGSDEPGFVDRFADAWLADLVRRPTWLAERDGRPIGVLVLVVVDNLPRSGRAPGRWAHVSLVYVTVAERDAGVGRALLEEMLSWAAANRITRIQLNANTGSARLYRRVAFAIAPDRLMELRL